MLHCLELLYNKNYFNVINYICFEAIQNDENQTDCSKLEQRFVIKFLVADKGKPCEIY